MGKHAFILCTIGYQLHTKHPSPSFSSKTNRINKTYNPFVYNAKVCQIFCVKFFDTKNLTQKMCQNILFWKFDTLFVSKVLNLKIWHNYTIIMKARSNLCKLLGLLEIEAALLPGAPKLIVYVRIWKRELAARCCCQLHNWLGILAPVFYLKNISVESRYTNAAIQNHLALFRNFT